MKVRTIIGADTYTYEDYINAINLNEEFDVNEQSVRDGSSLLQEAISVKKWDIAMDLVQRGINVNIQDNHGNTALHYLCSKPECIQLAEKILEAGGNPNIYNDANMTPLYSMVADMNGNYINSGAKYEMIELLLKYGADKTLKCVDGNTSMDVAEIIWDKRAIELLKSYDKENENNHYLKMLQSIDFTNCKSWVMTNLDDLAVLSAPFCYADGWNANYFEIDNVPTQMIIEKLHRMNIESSDDVYGFLEYIKSESANDDYLQFVEYQKDNTIDLGIRTPEGKELFQKCMHYAMQFQSMVGDMGFSAWDCSETIFVVRLAFSAGMITREEAQKLLGKILSDMKEKSFEQYACSFLCGGTYIQFKDDGKNLERYFQNWCQVINGIISDEDYWGR